MVKQLKQNLTKKEYKELDDKIDYKSGKFSMELPASKLTVEFKILTGADEAQIQKDLEATKKTGASAEITTRLRYMLVSVDGQTDKSSINKFAVNMLSQDSLALRRYYTEVSPDIDLTQEVEVGGEVVKVDIPMTPRFFWPDSNL